MTVGSPPSVAMDQSTATVSLATNGSLKATSATQEAPISPLKRKLDKINQQHEETPRPRTTTIKRRRRIHFTNNEKNIKESKNVKAKGTIITNNGEKKTTIVRRSKNATVSTAPSSSSSKDIGRPLNECDITVNMVVWAHIQGYPWWPSKVTF
jgi:hypothetical protein